MNLRLRIFIFNLLTVTAAFSLLVFVGFKMLSSTIIGNTYEKLKLIRVEKTRAIENYFRDVITASDLIATNVATLQVLNGKSPNTVNLHHIDEYARSFNLLDLILIRTDGTIAYATSPEIEKDQNIRKPRKNIGKIPDLFAWGMGAARGKFLLLDFDYEESAGNQALGYLATPIYNENRTVGVLVFRITINQIDQITSDNYSWSTHGLGKTGETLIYGEDWSLRNTSRFAIESGAGLTPTTPSFFATNRGNEDLYKLEEFNDIQEQGVDFRGVEVYRSIGKLYLPNGDHWFIQVKIDKSEALLIFRELILASAASGLLIMIVFSLLSFAASKKVMQPIELLIDNLEKLGTDNFSQKINYKSDDEIGTLVTKYNQLADRLEKTTVSKEFVDSVIASLKEYLFIVRVEKKSADAHPDAPRTPYHIVQANNAALEALGLTSLEIANRDLRKLIHISQEIQNQNWLLKHSHSMEADLQTPSGKRIPVLVNWSLLPEQRLNDLIFVFACTDITDTRANEMALIKAREEAINASMAKSEFLARMSHEIRTPLNAMIGMTEVLMDSELTDEQKKMLSISMNAGENLLAIINDILDLSKIEARQVSLEKIPFDASQITRHVCDIFAQKAKDKKLELRTKIDPTVPMQVIGDPTRTRQILLNLVANAIKFTEKGFIEIELRHSEKGMVFSVHDTGLGIPEEKRSLIFKNFSQADSSITRKFGGTGLGLAICKNLVELMSGEISFTSVSGEGSTFTFTLPLPVAIKQAAPPAVSNTKAPDRVLKLAKHLNLLIVDDTEDNRLLMKAFLKKQDCQISEATNGLEALDMVRKSPFDLIFMDVQMPVMDGYDATERIRVFEKSHGRERSLIIAISANALNEDIKNSLRAGCDDYIAKPIKKNMLYQILEKHFLNDSPMANR